MSECRHGNQRGSCMLCRYPTKTGGDVISDHAPFQEDFEDDEEDEDDE